MTTKSIAIVTGSARPGRVGHLVVEHVLKNIQPLLPTGVTLSLIDIAKSPAADLPLLDEPIIPQGLDRADPTPGYAHEHTRAWSTEIRKHDAFLLVTPQYNWGVPAALKNALDFLFWEWAGKPAMVVAYGGHGGSKVGPQLQQILGGGLKMKVVGANKHVGYAIDVRKGKEVRAQGGFGEEREGMWKKEGVDDALEEVFGELLGAVKG